MRNFQSAMPLLLALQALGQAPVYGGQMHPSQLQSPPVQMPPSQLQTPPLVGQDVPLSQPAQLVMDDGRPPPSRAEILEEKERFLEESRESVASAVRRIAAETEASRREIFADAEKSKQEYLAILEERTKQHLQDMDEQLATRKRDITDAGKAYSERLEKQAQELLAQLYRKECHDSHQKALAEVTREEHMSKQELEEQIRYVYDAIRAGLRSEPGPGIQAARQKFDDQIAALVKRRQDLEAVFQRNVALQHNVALADDVTTIWN